MKTVLLNVNPIVGYVDHFVKNDQLNQLRQDLKTVELSPAKILGKKHSTKTSDRIADSCRLSKSQFGSVEQTLSQVAAFLRLNPDFCERPVYIHYKAGGEYKAHFDAAVSGAMPAQTQSSERGNQRIYTGVLYLNGGFAGGTTQFPRLDLEILPKPGRLAFWQNTQACKTRPHPLSLHQGCPVESGQKKILTFWFRGPPE